MKEVLLSSYSENLYWPVLLRVLWLCQLTP
nr:MAG TPA: hypothetical protein [Caudoviricetes sp.]